MNIDQMRALGNECFAAFNQKAPEHAARAWSLWADMCRYVPFEAAPWIRDQIIELESMPRNFGKAVRDLFWRWKEETGRGAKIAACPDCDSDMPGYFLVWGAEHGGMPTRFVVRCACNAAPPSYHLCTFSREQAGDHGFRVLPQGESAIQFEARLAESVSPGCVGTREAYMNAVHNTDFSQSQRHKDALAEAEGRYA